MIYVRFYGGMGNQMFQYAFSRKLQYISNQVICIDASRGTEHAGINGDTQGCFAFDSFKKNENVIIEKNIIRYKRNIGLLFAIARFFEMLPRFINHIIKSYVLYYKLQYIIQSHINTFGMYTAFDCYVSPKVNCKLKNYYVSGLFTDKRYFDDIKEILQEDFTPICQLDDKNKAYLTDIEKTNSVCVHIRKGKSYTSSSILDVCTQSYYNNAIKKLETLEKDLVFFVFSNDLIWCRKILDANNRRLVFVDANDVNHPVEELRLMMNCKNFILSNSTMGWWAQYLSKNKKNVISPSKWSTKKKSLMENLIDDCWIKLDVGD